MSQEAQDKENKVAKEQTFLSHLFELRDRLLRSIIAVIAIFLVLFPFSEEIYRALASPLLSNIGEQGNMIAIGVAAPFLIPLKLVLVLSIFIAIPYLLYQMWMFIAPALYTSEKKLARPLVFSSTVLFYSGAAFAHFIVLPLAFAFFTSISIDGVEATTDIAYYLDFVLTVYFAFGIAFEVPIATFLVVAVGMTTPEKLATKRPYIIVGAFVIGMFLTPPDIISQTLLALPMWALFETGLVFSKVFLRNKKKTNNDSEEKTENVDTSKRPPKTSKEKTQKKPDYEILDSEPEFETMTDEEMDAELDAIEAMEDDKWAKLNDEEQLPDNKPEEKDKKVKKSQKKSKKVKKSQKK